MDEPSERKANYAGNEKRQLASYLDNCSSESTTTTTTTTTTSSDDQPMDMISSIHTKNDVDSMTSSISPPAAPAPAPVIINEDEIEGFNDNVDEILTEKETIQQTLEQKELKFNKFNKHLNKNKHNLLHIFQVFFTRSYICDNQKQYINIFCITLVISGLLAKCFFGLQVNNKLLSDITIKLFDDVAPRTCSYFRSVISGKRGYYFQNVKFDYLVVNKYFEDRRGQVMAYTRNGIRIRHEIKEKTNNLIHNREDLISMNVKTMRFGITLGPMPILDNNNNNNNNIIFGEIETGMEIIQSINARGIQRADVRCALEANPVHDDDSHTDAPFDTVNTDNAQPGAMTIDNSQISADDVGGNPIDNVVIYTCG
ncbi:unnamed protein product [Rotaria socialis]|uniref:PPIase cyclophilin-type domain-containing protein n=1 Tax=Rotaria socialis TaxID=392032 RepID=A0A818S705_9BILA|nr:unnamed protein product [Rotaria socialis]CAF4886267.1 unnamed protein product [Rotaria socialis]